MHAAPSFRHKSTNVRIEADATGRTLGITLAAWPALVALGAFDGVFSRLPLAVDVALAGFMALFAIGTYAVDGSVRARIDATPRALLAFVALSADASLVLVALGGSGDIAHGGLALLTLFVAPLGIAAHLPLLRAPANAARPVSRRHPRASRRGEVVDAS